jgi:choline dehydrogenase
VRRTDDLLDPDGGAGASVSPVNVIDGVRWNTALAYLDPVRSSPHLRVVADCLVDRIECVDSRAVAVHALVAGTARRIGADLVVLAAGTYATAPILLRSGIGAADELRSLGIDVVADLAGVGRHLQDQPVLRLEFSSTEHLDRELAAFAASRGFLPEEQTVTKLASSSANAPYDIHVFPWIEPDRAGSWRCVFPIGLLRPDSFGSIGLRSTDPTSAPIIDHRYLSERSDLVRLTEFVPWVLDLVQTIELRDLIGPPLRVPDSEVASWALRNHSHYWHPTGGAVLGGPDDVDAVCDAHGRVVGVDGLIVADASLFPRVPRATTALPVTAVGEHVAAMLA